MTFVISSLSTIEQLGEQLYHYRTFLNSSHACILLQSASENIAHSNGFLRIRMKTPAAAVGPNSAGSPLSAGAALWHPLVAEAGLWAAETRICVLAGREWRLLTLNLARSTNLHCCVASVAASAVQISYGFRTNLSLFLTWPLTHLLIPAHNKHHFYETLSS